MKKWLLLSLLLLIFPASSAVLINEIMYNPNQCSDYDCEWMELYNNGNFTIDLSNWTIDGNDFEDVNVSAGEYIVVARELIDGSDADNESFEFYWGNNDGIWNLSDGNYTAVDGDFSLTNTEDTILLRNASGDVEDNITYNNSMGADGDGNSLQLINNSWQACSPTPGAENNCSISGGNQTNQTNITGCDLSVSINITDVIYREGEEINYKLKVQDLNCQNIEHNYSVKYWIEDLFGAYLKNPYTSTYDIKCSDTSSHQKKAPSICGSEVYYIEAQIINHGCNNSESSNDFAQQMVIVKGKDPDSSACEDSNGESKSSTLTSSTSTSNNLIVEVLEVPNNATQGQTITIKVNITNKYGSSKAIQIYSYIYEGHTLITEGGWTGNKQEFTLADSSTKTIELTNTIKQDALLGIFTLKVRAKVGEEKTDTVHDIQILEGKQQVQQEETVEEIKNETKNKTQEHIPPAETYQPKNEPADGELITGAVIWTSKTNKNLSFAMLVFIAALLVLLTALIISLTRKR